MLNNEVKNILLSYFNQLIDLGIPQNSIYYSESFGIHKFIFSKDLLTDEIFNGIAIILENSFEHDENDMIFMNILPMSDRYIERANYPLAFDILENMEQTEYTPIPKNKISAIQEKHI